MAVWDVATGSAGGLMRFGIVQTDQNYAGNYSTIYYYVQMHNIPAATNRGSPVAVAANIGVDSHSGSFTWASNTPSKVILEKYVNVSHDANGYLNLVGSGAIAATGTSGLGGPTNSGNRAFSADRIPQLPSAPGAPVLTALSPSSIRVGMTLPADNGSAISHYGIQYADNAAFSAASYIEFSPAVSPRDLVDLAPGRTYWVRYRAHNPARGWGAFGPASSIRVGIGGKRGGDSAFAGFQTAKRLDANGSFVDLSTAKRLTEAGWVDIS